MVNLGRFRSESEKEVPRFRKTVKNSRLVEGIGLHSGDHVRLVFHPAEEGGGLCFYRKEANTPLLEICLDNVIDTSLAVTIGNGDYHVQTIEHLMFAIALLGITDLIIEIEGGAEIPILDGSAKMFIEALENCEFHEYSTEIKPIVLQESLMATDGDRHIVGLPADNFRVSYSIDYNHPMLKDQSIQLDFDIDYFREEVAHARTFGFLRDYESLVKRGLAQGGSLDNALVFTESGTQNQPRFESEAICHKVLDLIGDLALLGRPIQGHILCSKGGHSLDVAFGKKLSKLMNLQPLRTQGLNQVEAPSLMPVEI